MKDKMERAILQNLNITMISNRKRFSHLCPNFTKFHFVVIVAYCWYKLTWNWCYKSNGESRGPHIRSKAKTYKRHPAMVTSLVKVSDVDAYFFNVAVVY